MIKYKKTAKPCFHSCGPSDFCEGGKCDRMGCYSPPRRFWLRDLNDHAAQLLIRLIATTAIIALVLAFNSLINHLQYVTHR